MSFQYIVEVPLVGKKKYPSNYISTTKYNIITFLPYSLLLQFRRYANFYFLACAILQSIPLISPLSPYSAVLPLIFVLSLSMAREGFEDYKRWKSDKENNSNTTHVYRNENWECVPWERLKPGDVVKVEDEETFAVDMIPLYCSTASGISYVETASLDGEKNLKPKISIPETQLAYNSDPEYSLHNLLAHIECEAPNPQVSKFQGEMSIDVNGKKVKAELTHKNIMLRATKLKNTQWVVGLTVYTGKNTKIMQNGTNATNKVSNIERKVNRIILVILLFELFCCACSCLYNYLACIDLISFEQLILQSQNVDCSQIAGIAFGSYFILYSTYIPISLIVSLEFVKVFQGVAMQRDEEMYSVVNDRKMECHTVSINEELGQIEYILTDKTGTLTCNKMEFKNIIVGDQVYGEDIKLAQITEDFDFSLLSRRYSKTFDVVKQYFDSKALDYELSGSSETSEKHKAHQKQIELIFFMITTCHECLRQEKDDSYHGPSPDEVALLNAAKKIGFEFMNTENKITTVQYNKKNFKFQILKVIEFDSVRKRMTMVVKWNETKMVFVKGADTAISTLLGPNQKYLKFVTDKTRDMTRTGLRSLWFAYKTLPLSQDIEAMSTEELQRNLKLIGATGIEDRLQDFVPETIYSLRQGGIKFVMLTGDKLETAENIAKSCKMIEEGYLIDGPSKLKAGISHIRNSREFVHESVCPVIDGSTINFKDNEAELLEIIRISESAVFCRVTPAQKAEIVKVVKKLGKLTLAIGDGANDVNMILEAHVGVGIFGEEGTRAAQVSNYAIGEFCLIWKLLLYYGRLNYMRISEMILYFFYKNMVFTIVQFAYSFYNLGSGQSFWLSWSITFYNMVFTFFPVVLRAVFEVDVEIETNKRTLSEISGGKTQDSVLYSYYPKMYIVSQKNQLFTNLLFFEWFFLGVLQGVICLMITLYAMGGPDDTSGYSSYESGFYFAELSAYTSVIVVVTMKLAINVKKWNCLLLLSFLIPSLGAYVLYCFLSNYINISVVQYYFNDILTMPTFYLANILAILGMFSVDLLLFSIQATKNNFQNYYKFKALTGRHMTEANLQHLMVELEGSKTSKQ